MGMGREMIDWNKPIETVDGCKARLVEANIETGRIIIYTYSGSGDVFLVNDEGYRCDDRAIYNKRQEPFIRNVRVKREGWALVRREHGAPVFSSDRVYSSKKAAEEDYELKGGIPAFITWEE
jgi:hypothetical protein